MQDPAQVRQPIHRSPPRREKHQPIRRSGRTKQAPSPTPASIAGRGWSQGWPRPTSHERGGSPKLPRNRRPGGRREREPQWQTGGATTCGRACGPAAVRGVAGTAQPSFYRWNPAWKGCRHTKPLTQPSVDRCRPDLQRCLRWRSCKTGGEARCRVYSTKAAPRSARVARQAGWPGRRRPSSR